MFSYLLIINLLQISLQYLFEFTMLCNDFCLKITKNDVIATNVDTTIAFSLQSGSFQANPDDIITVNSRNSQGIGCFSAHYKICNSEYTTTNDHFTTNITKPEQMYCNHCQHNCLGKETENGFYFYFSFQIPPQIPCTFEKVFMYNGNILTESFSIKDIVNSLNNFRDFSGDYNFSYYIYNKKYSGISTDIKGKWFMAQSDAQVTFDTLFSSSYDWKYTYGEEDTIDVFYFSAAKNIRLDTSNNIYNKAGRMIFYRCRANCKDCQYNELTFTVECLSCISSAAFAWVNERKKCVLYKDLGNYYLDTKDGVYYPCYYSCSKCSTTGDFVKHNCDACDIGFYPWEDYLTQCYRHSTQPINYHFDQYSQSFIYCDLSNPEAMTIIIGSTTKKTNCRPVCSEPTLYYVENENKCVASCKENNLHLFAYDGECFETCPPFTILGKWNKCVHESLYEPPVDSYVDLDANSNEVWNQIENNILDYLDTGNNIKGHDFVLQVYPSTIEPEARDDISTINLGKCETIWREVYSIPDDDYLIIAKFDIESKNSITNQVEYIVFDSNGNPLDWELCKDVKIELFYPIKENDDFSLDFGKEMSEQGVDIYNAKSDYFNDICSQATINGTDIILNDRRNDIYQEVRFCEEGCEYNGINYDTKKASCLCDVKAQADVAEKEKVVDTFWNDNWYSVNWEIVKCYKQWKWNNVKYNVGFWFWGSIMVIRGIILFVYWCKEMPWLVKKLRGQDKSGWNGKERGAVKTRGKERKIAGPPRKERNENDAPDHAKEDDFWKGDKIGFRVDYFNNGCFQLHRNHPRDSTTSIKCKKFEYVNCGNNVNINDKTASNKVIDHDDDINREALDLNRETRGYAHDNAMDETREYNKNKSSKTFLRNYSDMPNNSTLNKCEDWKRHSNRAAWKVNDININSNSIRSNQVCELDDDKDYYDGYGHCLDNKAELFGSVSRDFKEITPDISIITNINNIINNPPSIDINPNRAKKTRNKRNQKDIKWRPNRNQSISNLALAFSSHNENEISKYSKNKDISQLSSKNVNHNSKKFKCFVRVKKINGKHLKSGAMKYKIEVNDLDNSPFVKAIHIDKRNCLLWYWAVFKEKQNLLRSINRKSEFELITINISVYLLNWSISFTWNALFLLMMLYRNAMKTGVHFHFTPIFFGRCIHV